MNTAETIRITRTEQLSDPYVVAGNRAYLVGTLDGDFPRMGWHSMGEMGGMWVHPVKFLDGFWLCVDGEWLTTADRFVGGAFSTTQEYVLENGVQVIRRQFVPDDEPALCISFVFRSQQPQELDLHLLARVDLRAVWPSEDHSASSAAYDSNVHAWICVDASRSWCLAVGAVPPASSVPASGTLPGIPHAAHGDGPQLTLDFTITVGPEADAQLDVVVAGSSVGRSEAAMTYCRLAREVGALWDAKLTRYGRLLAHSTLSIPDRSIQCAWDWMKCNLDWLIRAVPGIGRGLGGGLEEYPWWFGCDSAYSVLGALALGQHDVAIDTIDLVRTLSVRAGGPSGRVMHEASTEGRVIGPGSAAETPHFITTLWQTFLWTGDSELLERCYTFCRDGLLGWTVGECCRDGSLLPYGFGITERKGMDLQCVDVATHTVSALGSLAAMARVVGDDAVAARCAALYPAARAQLEAAFWMDHEGLYGDMLATPREMVPRIQVWLEEEEGAYYASAQAADMRANLMQLLRKAQSDSEPDRKRPWLLKHWIVLSPIEAGSAPPDHASRALTRLASREFVGPWGMYLSGMDQSQAMSINTGALAVAQARYGRASDAIESVRVLTDTLEMHMPGAISEISPSSGCFVQAWSAYAVAWPLTAHVFGLHPNAHRREVRLEPNFPVEWPEARLTNVQVGATSLDLNWDGNRVLVDIHEPGWTLISPSVPAEMRVT